MTIFLPELIEPRRVIAGRTFDFDRQVAVMAVVNRTPDSFYDKGATFALERAVEAVDQAILEGADWVDIGGVKFSPDGPEVTAAEEAERVLPVVLSAARTHPGTVISVDTFRVEVAAAALAAGAHVVNDTTGLHDPALADLVAANPQAQLIITHSLAKPRTHFPRPSYADVARDIAAFLRDRVDIALSRGVRPEQIIIDPGHDLNKNTRHTLELTRRLDEIAAVGYPMLAAVSNKDFVGETLDRPQGARLEGSLAAEVVSILLGARIVRMHNVRAAVDAARMTEAILGWREPAYLKHNV
ncbi:dihydropteroate synthase [Hamadaea flava]|nr:dihydropteroate synthase [Hamadaea flava]MCP2324116.1 dihydropteroate synthase [Hamadaea flava]